MQKNRVIAMYKKNDLGFTLIELMIVIVVMAIIVSIALPSYQSTVRKARRSEAKALLLEVSAAEVRYFTNRSQYTDSVTGALPAGLGYSTDLSTGGHYRITAAGAPNTFTLTATPQGDQASDSICANITITDTGVKGATGSSSNIIKDCW